MNKWYYTREGQQHGPIAEEELKSLVASGQVTTSSLAWTDGMPDWVAISTIPALVPATAGVPASPSVPPIPAPSAPAPAALGESLNPYAAPVTDMSQPGSGSLSEIGELEEIIPGSQPIDIGACIGRAFELTKRHFGMLVLIGIIMLAISTGVSVIMGLIDGMLGWAQSGVEDITGNPNLDGLITGLGNNGSILNQIVSGVVDVFLGLGVIRIGLNVVSGKPFTIGMLFSQGRVTFRAVLAKILFSLIVLVGLILLIIPGIYLALRFGQYENAIVDKDLGVFDAFSYSSRITAENKLPLVGLFILCFLIVVAGAIALLVGLLFAVPLATLAPLVAYRWMQHGSASVADR